jgi:hypothetical protein
MPRDLLSSVLNDSGVELMWRRTRTVWALHPDMAAELADCTSGMLAGSVFKQLPYTDPLLVFPEPVPTTLANGDPGWVCGVYVVGTKDSPDGDTPYCHTDDDDMTSLFLNIATLVDTDEEAWECTRVRVPLADRFTLDEVIEGTVDRHVLDRTVADHNGERLAAFLREVLPLIMSTLLYACTDDADIQAVPAPRADRKPRQGKGKKDARRDKRNRLMKIGWRLGPALKAARRAAHHWHPTGPGTGRRLPPHQRRGHFKMVRYGPRWSQEKPAYIKPYMVSLDLLKALGLETRLIPIRPRHTRAGGKARRT